MHDSSLHTHYKKQRLPSCDSHALNEKIHILTEFDRYPILSIRQIQKGDDQVLDESDLRILAGMFAASEERMITRMDSMESRLTARMDSMDARMDSMENRMDSMEERLDAKIDSVAQRLDAKIDSVAQRLDAKIDSVAQRLDARIDSLKVQMKKTEDLFMDELAKTSDYLERKIDKLQGSVDEVRMYYRIHRLDDDNAKLLMRVVKEL